MNDSLFPERPLQISPSLAAAIGLEQAILLQQINALLDNLSDGHATRVEDSYQWGNVSLQSFCNRLPFWNAATIRRVLQNLIELGMVFVDPFPSNIEQVFQIAINQTTTQNPSNNAQPNRTADNQQATPNLGAHRITNNWQPSNDAVQQLMHQGIDTDFINHTIQEFTFYWLERNETSHAWSSKFIQHVTRRWQQEQQKRQEAAKALRTRTNASSTMAGQWQPNEDATEILTRMGIHENFIFDAIPEFVLYWQERGEAQTTWNSKFVSHVKRQWARYTHTLKNDTEPTPMRDNWQPDQDVFEVLSIANIDINFARQLVPEFMMYWRDKNELHHSWNTKFLQYTKHQWSRQHNEKANNGTHRSNTEKRRTKDRSLLEDLTDRSWAG